MDLVRKLSDYCDQLGISFRYGSSEHLNLLEGDVNQNNVYLLLFPVKRSVITNNLKTSFAKFSYSGSFMLIKGADYGGHYFNELGNDQGDSKYTLNIEPLLRLHLDLFSLISCEGLDVDSWDCQDAINALDANKDGILCTFKITENV